MAVIMRASRDGFRFLGPCGLVVRTVPEMRVGVGGEPRRGAGAEGGLRPSCTHASLMPCVASQCCWPSVMAML